MKTSRKRPRPSSSDSPPAKLWQMCVYVAGRTPKSLTAFSNLKPQPVRKIIGDLSDTGRVLVDLDLRPSD